MGPRWRARCSQSVSVGCHRRYRPCQVLSSPVRNLRTDCALAKPYPTRLRCVTDVGHTGSVRVRSRPALGFARPPQPSCSYRPLAPWSGQTRARDAAHRRPSPSRSTNGRSPVPVGSPHRSSCRSMSPVSHAEESRVAGARHSHSRPAWTSGNELPGRSCPVSDLLRRAQPRRARVITSRHHLNHRVPILRHRASHLRFTTQMVRSQSTPYPMSRHARRSAARQRTHPKG